ncbi:Cyanate hydratase [Ceratobasidium sp. 414]|nr:Cyanate hydratase [Ceratobasidium sp. 414]
MSGTQSQPSATAVASSPVLLGLPPACKQLMDAKARKGMSFADVGKAIGKDEIWTAALFYGQARFPCLWPSLDLI